MLTRVKFQKMKEANEKITMVTAYDYPTAKLAEQAGVDMILVGDSVANVVLGYDSTIPITVDDMIHHGRAVKRGAKNTFIVVDMPFMSYHISLEDTLYNAKRIFQETSCHALKLEGAGDVIEKVSKLTKSGIPIVGHIGLTPQSVNVLGGYRIQGKSKEDAQKLLEDAKELERAGAMAIVLECVPLALAKMITEELSIPTIGIGAGKYCDGQVLVFHDLLQFGVDRLAKFVKPYGNVNDVVLTGLKGYIEEVKKERFPSDEYSYMMDEEELKALYGGKQDENHSNR
jgi:3-methyl-2-oxobutanoate hydroxymethyltransferase